MRSHSSGQSRLECKELLNREFFVSWSHRRMIKRCLLLSVVFFFFSIISGANSSLLHAEFQVSSTPVIISISPKNVWNDQATTITITGAGFVATPTVTVSTCSYGGETVVLTDVTLIDQNSLTATVPASLVEGAYFITIRNPDGGSDTSLNDLIVMRPGENRIESWNLTATMTSSRRNFAAVAVNGYLFALGTTIERAEILPDGSLGPWQLVGTLPQPSSAFAAIAIDDAIYVLGGQTGDTNNPEYLNNVIRTNVNDDGSLGSWQDMPPMISARSYLSVVTVNDHLYALGGRGSSMNIVEKAAILSDGTLGSWEATTPMLLPRSNVVTHGDYLYALGDDNNVERAQVQADGTLGAWQLISAMSHTRSEFATVVRNGYIYAIGSFYPCIYGTNSVERAKIQEDGSIGPWQLTASMWVARSGLAAVTVDNRIYVLGGDWGNREQRSVEYLSIQDMSSRVFLPMVAR